jgi:hypothetical protein
VPDQRPPTREGRFPQRPVPALRAAARLRALAESGLTETPEPAMQHYAHQVRDRLGVPVALMSLVQADQRVFPGMIGLAEPWASTRCTPLSHSLCQYVVATAGRGVSISRYVLPLPGCAG